MFDLGSQITNTTTSGSSAASGHGSYASGVTPYISGPVMAIQGSASNTTVVCTTVSGVDVDYQTLQSIAAKTDVFSVEVLQSATNTLGKEAMDMMMEQVFPQQTTALMEPGFSQETTNSSALTNSLGLTMFEDLIIAPRGIYKLIPHKHVEMMVEHHQSTNCNTQNR
jgi:hypothetical protein